MQSGGAISDGRLTRETAKSAQGIPAGGGFSTASFYGQGVFWLKSCARQCKPVKHGFACGSFIHAVSATLRNPLQTLDKCLLSIMSPLL